MDCLIRFHRMRGDRTLWQCGTDHAGIATQMVVERALAESGRTRVEMGREAFTAAVWDWKQRSGDTITRQLRRLGTSMDWSRERFTLDPDVSRAVTEVFVRLHDEGLIYRGQRLVNWDPVLHTAISDLEVQATEETGQLWHIRYPLSSGEGHLVVATTRPETMLGDVAVAVHPDDDRYQRYIGKMLDLPLTGRTIPVIADEMVDKEFGSGCVKITPAHDFNDYEVGRRHGLPSINIFTADACINDQGPPAYVGLDRDEARRRIVADLEERRAPGADSGAQAHGAARRSQRRRHRALPDRPMVRAYRAARRPGHRGGRGGPHPLRPGGLGQDLFRVDAQHRRLVHLAPALVGPSHPGLVRPRGQCLRRPRRSRGTRPVRHRREHPPAPGPRCPRHLVLLGAVAVLDLGLARRHPRASDLLSHQRAGHRLRHHLLLGRAHGHDGAQVHGRCPVPGGVHPRARARSGRAEDVEVQGQHPRSHRPHRRHRSGGPHRQAHRGPHAAQRRPQDREGHPPPVPRGDIALRDRRPALHVRRAGDPGPRHPLRPRAHRGLSELLQQALERRPLRPDGDRRTRPQGLDP